MELAPQVYETAAIDSGTAFILNAAGIEQADPAPNTKVSDFDSEL